jgi:molybdenum cofactor biosynthesis enzyme MoaA
MSTLFKFLEIDNFLYLERKYRTGFKKREIIHKADKLLSLYLWNSELKNLIKKENYWKGIKAIDILVTPKCNINCKVCYVKYGRENCEEMDVENFKKILKLVNNAKIVLNGGEVTTREDLKELIKLTIKSGNQPVIYTNGLKISNLNYLRELKNAGLKEVVISFEGFREEIYEKLRSGKDEFELVLKALRNLEKERIRTSIYTTIAKGINDDQIGPILEFAATHGFIWTVSFKPIYLTGVSPHSELNETNLISYSELLNLIARKIKGINLNYILSLRKMFSIIQQSLANKNNPIYLSWLEIPTIFVKREKGRFKPFFPSSLMKLLSKQPISSIVKHTLSTRSYLQLDELFYRLGIRKITLGTISPYVPTFLTASPTLRQLNNKIVFSSYLAW